MDKTASEIADLVLQKCAEITEEEIARGLSGVPGREGITPEEVEALGQENYENTYANKSKRPLIGGAVGSGLGAIVGGSLGGGGGALAGAALGGAGGAGIGQLSRKARAKSDQRFMEGLGNVARTGRIPHSTPSRDLGQYSDYAEGIQEDRISPEALERHRVESARHAKEQAILGALGGALTGNVMSGMQGDGSELRNTLYGGAAGGLRGYSDARQLAGMQEDLHERGYGHLADALRRRNAG